MANQRLSRLKLLMKDRDFDWPSEEEIRGNKLKRDLIVAETQSTASSLTERTDLSIKASDFSEPPLDSSSMSSFTPSIAFQSEFAIPLKNQNNRTSTSAAGKATATTARKTAINQCQVGDMADINVSFCPITAVSKYPYRFMNSHGPANKMLVDQISRELFAKEKFWDRAWTV